MRFIILLVAALFIGVGIANAVAAQPANFCTRHPNSPKCKPPTNKPPTTPNNLRTTSVDQTSVGLAWDASTDNSGVAPNYRVFKNGAQVTTTASTSYTFLNLTCGTSYTFGVEAYDAQNLTSSRSLLTVATSACDPPPPPPPSSGRVYMWGFDAPHCSGNMWAQSSWLSPSCSDPDWYTEGIYYSVPDSSVSTNVLTQDVSGVDSTGTWQAWVHNPLTVDGSSWGTEHRVDIVVKLVRWGSQAQSICSWAGGPKIFMGRPQDIYETSTYTIELAVCDGSIHIQKKEWGVFSCGTDPRAVDCGAGGTWYLLAQSRPGVPSFGVWHTFSAIKQDNPDGSVTLIGLRDGVEVIRYVEQPNDLPLGPLRGGREGWRSNAIDWHMDSFSVTVK